ncbi:hypothetical protein AZJ96_10965 [Streptococcus pneumoniae]|nr:hypothetical protein AZK21_10285 [Streptococcus pneumoniae]TVW10866.1 hypothetical protein AZK09_06210 [Streptococcus pneumoniae]TVW21696.1 hypothetical protein AZK07_08880 [Streptococcus pneumoniae]TVX09595.1 hypothetical protein AZJ54_05655 [Streptococcus pneumoniae]TXM02347.1 hypothetical protein AZJ96_10965 [Streptococcus pneumoniae]
MGSFSLKEITLSLTFRSEKARSLRQAFHLIRGLELLGWRAKAKISLGLAGKTASRVPRVK